MSPSLTQNSVTYLSFLILCLVYRVGYLQLYSYIRLINQHDALFFHFIALIRLYMFRAHL
jgi:hypothetical protein